MSNTSESELPPHPYINVRLNETTARMLHVAHNIQKETRTSVVSRLIRDWLTSPDRNKTVGGYLIDFQPVSTSPFDPEVRLSLPMWVRGMLFKAAGNSDIETWADIIRAALEDMLPPLMKGAELSVLEARVNQEALRDIDAMLQEIQEIRDSRSENEKP